MRPRLLLVLLGLLALAPAAPAAAASPGFVGVNVDGPAVEPTRVVRELRRVARTGATAVRWAVNWSELQPHASWDGVPEADRARFRDVNGIPTDFAAGDRFVATAARLGLDVLPVVMSSAPWAAENPYVVFSPPVDPAQFGRFARTLAERYGRSGSFWRERPRVPFRPIRTWQIWNEPAGNEGFGAPGWAWNSNSPPLPRYMAMLAAASGELRAADPGVRVMLSGFYGRAWISLRQLYAAGARNLFDAVGLHPFTRKPRNVLKIVRRSRAVMTRNGDARKPIAVTELAWPSSRGKVVHPYNYAMTKPGQAAMLVRGYRALHRARRALGIRTVYWYTWMTPDTDEISNMDHAGLLAAVPGRTTLKPAFWAFRRVARRLNGAAR